MTLSLTQEQRRTRRNERLAEADRPATDDVALAVWHELVRANYDGCSIEELVRALPSLSRQQLRQGVERVRQVLEQTGEVTLVCLSIRGRGSVYKMPANVGEYRTWAGRQLSDALSRVTNQITRSEAALLVWPDDLPPYLPKQLRRLAEDAQELLDELRRGK